MINCLDRCQLSERQRSKGIIVLAYRHMCCCIFSWQCCTCISDLHQVLPISTHQEICHDLCSLTCTIYIAHKIALICRSSAADFASGEAQILQLEVHRPSGPFFCLKIYLEEMNLQCSSCYSSLQLYLSLLKIAASKTCHGWPMSC